MKRYIYVRYIAMSKDSIINYVDKTSDASDSPPQLYNIKPP